MRPDPVTGLPPLLPVLPREGRLPYLPVAPLRRQGGDPLVDIAAVSPPLAADGPGEAAPGAAGQAAMRLDQATLSRLVWQPPDAVVLAQAWSELARQQGRAAEETRRALTVAALKGGATPAADAMAPSASVRPDPHFLPVYSWGGSPLLLALAVAEDAQSPWRRRRQRPASLRLELTPPLLGRLLLEVHWVIGGLELAIALEDPRSVAGLREALPAVSNAWRRAGLTLLRVQLRQGPVAFAKLRNGPPGSFPGQSQWQSLLQLPGEMSGLFRALAETSVVLMGHVPAPDGRG